MILDKPNINMVTDDITVTVSDWQAESPPLNVPVQFIDQTNQTKHFFVSTDDVTIMFVNNMAALWCFVNILAWIKFVRKNCWLLWSSLSQTLRERVLSLTLI